ncbi:unnamed protein product [Brassica oleracea var. botrytis]
MYNGPPEYPKIGDQPFFPPPERTPSFQHNSSPSSSSCKSLPPLLPRVGDITRSSFQFDFCLERKVLAEAEKDNLLPHLLKPYHIINEVGVPIQGVDPVVMKYAGLSREVVNIAVANYGDNPTKLHLSYFHLSHSIHFAREMGFPTNAVADALFMFENDTEKALSHLLHGSS